MNYKERPSNHLFQLFLKLKGIPEENSSYFSNVQPCTITCTLGVDRVVSMVLGKLTVPGRPTVWVIVGQGPIALAVGARGGCLDILLSSILSLLFLPLWETVRYRLKYCLRGPLNPKQPSNQLHVH